MLLRLDVETFSTIPISHGARAYMAGAELLMAAYRIVEGNTKLPLCHWDVTEDPCIPQNLLNALNDPAVLITAYNSPFERLAVRELLGLDLPAERFRCTMVRAYALGFKGKLHEVGAQMGLDHNLIKYHASGQKMINKFCKMAPKNRKVDRYTRENSPEEWQEFIDYNIQDIVAEEAVDEKCDGYIQTPEWNQRLWVVDQKINDRGVPIDMAAIRGAQKIRTAAKHELGQEITGLTGITTPGSGPMLINWLQNQGVDIPLKWSTPKKAMVPTLEEAAVETMLARETDPVVCTVLELKQQIGKSSVAKYDSFANAQVDGRVYGMYQFGGAQRTNRWCLAGDTQISVLREGTIVSCLITEVQLSDRVWDGEEFVAHEGVVFSGTQEVIEYDGIKGTSEHIVFTECGKEVRLSDASKNGYRLKVARSPDTN